MAARRPPVFALHVLHMVVAVGLFGACGAGDADPTQGAASTNPIGDSYQGGDGALPDELPPIETGPKILFLGDSLAAGLHLSVDQAFPNVLQRKLFEEGLPFRLVNAGVSGDTTAGGLGRIDWMLKQEPDWVVIELGANDALRGVPLETTEANLRAIVERVEAEGVGVVLLGQVMFTNYGPDYVRGFQELYDRIAEEYNLVYVPYFLEGVGGVPEMNLPDGLHPTPEGHEKIAEKLLPTFRELLQDA